MVLCSMWVSGRFFWLGTAADGGIMRLFVALHTAFGWTALSDQGSGPDAKGRCPGRAGVLSEAAGEAAASDVIDTIGDDAFATYQL